MNQPTPLSELKLTRILDSIEENFSILDRQCRVLYMNPAAEAALMEVHLKREDVLGKVIWDVLPDLVGTEAYHATLKALEKNEPQRFEMHYEPLDRWSEGRIYPGPEGLSAFSRDITALKRAEQDLRKWRQIFSSVPWGLALADRNGERVLDCNPAFARMHGYAAPQDVAGRPVFDMFADSMHAAQTRIMAELARDGHKLYESLHVRRDGSTFPVLINVAVIPDPLGEPQYRVAAVQDISSLKMIERKLTEQQDMLETISMLGRMLNAELNLESLLQTVTDVCTRLCRAAIGAFLFNVHSEAGHVYQLYALSGASKADFNELPMPGQTAIFGPTLRGEEAIRIDDVLLDPRYGKSPPYHGLPPGHPPVRSYLAVPVVARGGEVLGGLFFGHPEPGRFAPQTEALVQTVASQAATAITTARLYEDAVTAREEAELERQAFRTIADSVPQLMYTADVTGRVEYVNQTFRQYAGLEGSQSPDLSILVHPEERAQTRARWEEALRQGTELVVENRLRGADGTYRWFLNRTIPLRNRDGHIVQWLGAAMDIEERMQAEAALQRLHGDLEARVNERTRELQEANEKLREVDALKSQFISSMSHELRTPLNAIIGFSELLRTLPDAELTAAERRTFVEHIVTSAHLLLDQVNDVLDLGRIDAGKLELDIAMTLLRRPVESAIELVRPLAQAKGITLQTELAEDVRANVDEARFNQILLNLLSNAIKFTPAGGTVTVRLPTAGAEVRIEVEDTGIGIPAGDLQRIFEPFERVGRGLAATEPGTGLGLAISRRLVEAHRGRLEVRSEPGRGSTFVVALPSG